MSDVSKKVKNEGRLPDNSACSIYLENYMYRQTRLASMRQRAAHRRQQEIDERRYMYNCINCFCHLSNIRQIDCLL